MRSAAIVISTIALLLLAGCESNKVQPTSAEFNDERARLLARVEAHKNKQDDPAQAKPVAHASDTIEGGLGGSAGFTYDATGLRDPFRSFEWERMKLEEKGGGPLEQFDVSQLSVVAVVWQTGSARALVQDPAGESYIVGLGTPIGKNDGTITKIGDNLIVVRETYEDYLGQVTQKDIEMRIRLSEGG